MIEMETPQAQEEVGGTLPDSDLKFTLEEVPSSAISIKVIGIGGCGGNIVNHMIERDVGCVEFAAVNTDEQALAGCRAPVKIRLGPRVTHGHGTGSNPEIGREAALESTEELTEMIGDADLVFITTGLGGGTGTGAAPVIASLAKQIGALTIATAIKPFDFEGGKRAKNASKGVADLLDQADTTVIIPNERMLEKADQGSSFFDGFLLGNDVVTEILVGITDVITKTGVMNCDFADLRTALQDAGRAVVATARASGRDAAVQAAKAVISSQAIEHDGLSKAGKVLVNVTGSGQFGLHDASEALKAVQQEIGKTADLTVGVVRDESLGEDVRVLLMASGFSGEGFGLEVPPEPVREAVKETPWRSQRVVELMDSEAQRPSPDSGQDPNEPGPPGGYRFNGEDEQPAAARAGSRSDHRPQDEQDAGHGESFEYMPPPNIRIEKDADEEPTLPRPSFFRRRARGR